VSRSVLTLSFLRSSERKAATSLNFAAFSGLSCMRVSCASRQARVTSSLVGTTRRQGSLLVRIC
jgi:hypothetical protein